MYEASNSKKYSSLDCTIKWTSTSTGRFVRPGLDTTEELSKGPKSEIDLMISKHEGEGKNTTAHSNYSLAIQAT